MRTHAAPFLARSDLSDDECIALQWARGGRIIAPFSLLPKPLSPRRLAAPDTACLLIIWECVNTKGLTEHFRPCVAEEPQVGATNTDRKEAQPLAADGGIACGAVVSGRNLAHKIR